jgi:predicted HicB family RNase H-like nuclease
MGIEIEPDTETRFSAVFAIRVPPSLHDQVHRAAASEYMSAAAWGRRLILEALRTKQREIA